MSEGTVGTIGGLNLTLNPPKPEEAGVSYDGDWLRVELDDDKLTVRIFGQATYGTRKCIHHEDIDDPGLAPLKAVLKQVLDAYGEQVKSDTVQAAYAARSFALGQKETL